MTMQNADLVARFNPANAKNLTPQDLNDMRNLTDAELDQLAEAYPNKPAGKAYLRLYDTSVAENKQLYPLSTWQNLRNVRKFSNMKNLKPFDFFDRNAKPEVAATATRPGKAPAVKKVVDLSAQEAAAELAQATATKTTAPAPQPGKSAAKKTAEKAPSNAAKNKKAETNGLKEATAQESENPDASQEFPGID